MRIHERIEELDKDRRDLLALVHDMLNTIALPQNESGTVGQLYRECGRRWVREFNMIDAVDPGDL